MRRILAFLGLFTLLCSQTALADPPTLTGIQPNAAAPGAVVYLSGTNLGEEVSDGCAVELRWPGTGDLWESVPIFAWTDTEVSFLVPSWELPASDYSVRVIAVVCTDYDAYGVCTATAAVPTNSLPFTLTDNPTLNDIGTSADYQDTIVANGSYDPGEERLNGDGYSVGPFYSRLTLVGTGGFGGQPEAVLGNPPQTRVFSQIVLTSSAGSLVLMDPESWSGDDPAADYYWTENRISFLLRMLWKDDNGNYKDDDRVQHQGFAQGGGPFTITLDTAASSQDGAYDGMRLNIIAGTGKGQTRIVASYAGATRTATVAADWDAPGAIPDATSKFEIIQERVCVLPDFVYPGTYAVRVRTIYWVDKDPDGAGPVLPNGVFDYPNPANPDHPANEITHACVSDPVTLNLTSAPWIWKVKPQRVTKPRLVKLIGANFGSQIGDSYIEIYKPDGVTLTATIRAADPRLLLWSPTLIKFRTANNAADPIPLGKGRRKVRVVVGGRESNGGELMGFRIL